MACASAIPWSAVAASAVAVSATVPTAVSAPVRSVEAVINPRAGHRCCLCCSRDHTGGQSESAGDGHGAHQRPNRSMQVIVSDHVRSSFQRISMVKSRDVVYDVVV